MIDLTHKDLPNAVVGLDGKSYLLNTDFRIWIKFYNDYENDEENRDISYIFKNEVPVIDDFILAQLRLFLFNPSVTPVSSGSSGDKVMDYLEDGEYIFSALYAVYGIDITEMDMHWHKFQALCNNIVGENTLWGYAKQMRGYVKPSKNDTYEKQCVKAKQAWSLPTKLTNKEQEKIDEFNKYFE